jgi:hypothetical protein
MLVAKGGTSSGDAGTGCGLGLASDLPGEGAELLVVGAHLGEFRRLRMAVKRLLGSVGSRFRNRQNRPLTRRTALCYKQAVIANPKDRISLTYEAVISRRRERKHVFRVTPNNL